MTELNVKSVKVADLIPYTQNSRIHNDAQVSQIAASIKEFGWTNPILVGDQNNVIAGHGRLLAAKKLGMDEVPVIVLGDLSSEQQKALVIADNKLALNAAWDEELLKIELADLVANGFDYDAIGFSTQELDALLKDGVLEVEDEDEETETNYVIQYNIVFDNEAQQAVWFNFIRKLKEKYEDHETVAERLTAFIGENELG